MAGTSKQTKKDLSYTYWHGKGGGDAPLQEPQKLSTEELAALEAQQTTCPAASAWNAAGTWEERNWTSWAQGRVKELVAGLRAPLAGGGELATVACTSCTGDATVACVRGKLRYGFDLECAISWTAQLPPPPGGPDEARAVSGTLRLPDASRDAAQSGDLDVEVVVDKSSVKKAGASDAEARAVTQAAKALTPALLAALRTLDAEMQARMQGAPAAS